MASFVKVPPPRQLNQKETLDSLNHWKTIFRNYFRRDAVFKQFLSSSTTWDPHQPNYGLAADDDITAEDRKDALVDFLHHLAGFLPHSYLTSKLVENTSKLEDCWDIIYEHYNVQVTPETFLDGEAIRQEPNENYRQFYERLLQHAKLHLAPIDAKVDGMKNQVADKMSISLMNHIAVQWLRKINTDLIQIVKTEYSTELRSGEQLASLVPRIAPNIDSLLSRYSSTNVNSVSAAVIDAIYDSENSESNVMYARGRGGISFRGRGRGGGHDGARGGRSNFSAPFCAGCFSMAKQLNTFIDFKHKPAACPRQRVVSRFLQAAEEAITDEPLDDDNDFYDGRNQTNPKQTSNIASYLQNDQKSTTTEADTVQSKRIQNLAEAPPQNIVLTINLNQSSGEMFEASQNKFHSEQESLISDFKDTKMKVQKLQQRKHLWSCDGVRKERSPMVAAMINTTVCTPTIDEGSEINFVDESFAIKAKIVIVSTRCSATAAGSSAMTLAGQTKDNVVLRIPHESPISWNLGKCVIVENLGVDVLVGEPAKVDNTIITKSNLKIIETLDEFGKPVQIPYFNRNDEKRFMCKAKDTKVLLNGEIFQYKLPELFHNETYLAVSPIKNNFNFVQPKIVEVNEDKTIDMKNESGFPVTIRKNFCFAEITKLVDIDIYNNADTCAKVCTEPKDDTHLQRPKLLAEIEANKSYTDQVIIDPDNQLTEEWRTKFKKVCDDFTDVINPNPGRYNNFYGDVDCSIDFCSSPPPSVKARLPNYSHEKLKIMGNLMDKMENMGVLAKPEDVGVSPSFVVPSLLVPKAEKDEWRLVSDFTPLNNHIRKFETVAPGIEETKRILARYKFNIEMDLSNYFWQGGMRKEDLQYLATPHPFKGLRVYTVEPQGLKNASEHSYERLSRIYGDLRQTDRMASMADGLYAVGDTVDELMENFVEILRRARNSGLTFKPKKIIIAPKETVLFGWKKIGDGWTPINHTVSPLSKAEEPNTVKQLRSFLGSYKQLSECIEGYAVLLKPLEAAVAGKNSADRVEWTEDLSNSFKRAKYALDKVDTIFVPKPSDKLDVFTDYSEEHKAVGGRLVITRREDNKPDEKLLAGHFSCMLNNHQRNWLPCECEAAGVKLVVKHFSPFIRESVNITTIHTDNLPTVHAWKRLKTGAFSASARVASFLTGLSALNVEIVHKPGKDMLVSDYYSRHPNSCNEERCKICKFAFDIEKIGDAAIHQVKTISANDVEKGLLKMPHTQRNAWKKIQSEDRVHTMLLDLIACSKTPEKKRTKGDFTKLKRLHNLYRTGQLKVAHDGLVTVSHSDNAGNNYEAISVPAHFFPGLVHALHIKLNHPSKTQMQRLVSRFFYSAGHARIIEEVSAACSLCAALKTLPKEIFSESTEETPTFGANFSADIIKKDAQLIFLCREKLSQLTITRFIPDETADSIRDAIVLAVLEFIPDSGTKVQVDCAPALQTLAAESKMDGSILKKLGIEVDLGRTLNKNKNPIAENAIKEFHKERLKLNPCGGKVSEIERAIITKNINSRVRERGLTPKEIAFNRDQISNSVKPSDDEALAKKQVDNRTEKHPKNIIKVEKEGFKLGDNVYLKSGKSKLRGREMFKIVNLFQKNGEHWAVIQKCEQKFMTKKYEVKWSEIFRVPGIQPYQDPFSDNDLEEDDDTHEHNKEEKPGEIENSTELKPSLEPSLKPSLEQFSNSKPDQEKRPRREAAKRSRSKLQDILHCLKTKSKPACKDPPLHGWIYEDWVKDIEESDEEILEEDPPKQGIKTPFSLLLDGLDFHSFTFPMQDRAQTGGLLQMFPLHEEVGQSLSWDHLTSPEELIPHSERDHLDAVLEVALTPRQLFPDIDASPLQTSVESDDDDVFNDHSVLEVSIEGRTRTKSSTKFNLLDTVEDHHDEIGREQNEEDEEDKDETGTKPKKRTRSTTRVNYAYLHSYGRKEKDGDKS